MDRYIKYPRTFHLPWSTPHDDDKMMSSLAAFEGEEVVVTVKMDGENCTMYSNHLHALSLDSSGGMDRHMVKRLHSQIAHEIPAGWRLCGENLYIRHSIHYQGLKSYFYLFSIWNEANCCLSWDETAEWARLLNLVTVPQLYRGLWQPEKIQSLYAPTFEGNECEGYVVRVARSFAFNEFHSVVGKVVRKGHVQTTAHWRHQTMVPNDLGDGVQI